MLTHARPTRRIKRTPATQAVAKTLKTATWPLKIGQTIFVGITIISFVLLFQGK